MMVMIMDIRVKEQQKHTDMTIMVMVDILVDIEDIMEDMDIMERDLLRQKIQKLDMERLMGMMATMIMMVMIMDIMIMMVMIMDTMTMMVMIMGIRVKEQHTLIEDRVFLDTLEDMEIM